MITAKELEAYRVLADAGIGLGPAATVLVLDEVQRLTSELAAAQAAGCRWAYGAGMLRAVADAADALEQHRRTSTVATDYYEVHVDEYWRLRQTLDTWRAANPAAPKGDQAAAAARGKD